MISDTMKEWFDTVSFTRLPEDTERVNGLPILDSEPNDPDDEAGESDKQTMTNGENENEDPEK